MWKLKILRSIFNLIQDKDINGYNGYFVKATNYITMTQIKKHYIYTKGSQARQFMNDAVWDSGQYWIIYVEKKGSVQTKRLTATS